MAKSAIAVARQFSGRQRNFVGGGFWARSYAVSTVGFELEQVMAYSRHQKHVDIEEIGLDALLDIWQEWDGIREAVEESPHPPAPSPVTREGE